MLELFETTQRVKIRLCPYTTCKSGTRFGCVFCALTNNFNKTKQFYFTLKNIKKQAFSRRLFFCFYISFNSPTNPRKMGGQRQLSHKSQRGLSAIFEG